MWTESREQFIREQWQRGCTGSEIAEALGTTRSAVLGKLNRMGLARCPRAPHDPNMKPPRRQRVRRPSWRDEAPIHAPCARNLHVSELSYGECKWPTAHDAEGWMFCAAPSIDGKSYCAFHQVLGTRAA